MGIVKQNDGPISWPTGGTGAGAELDDPSDQFDRRNVAPFPTDVPSPSDLKESR